MRHTQQALDHGEIDGRTLHIDQLSGKSQPVGDQKRQNNCDPVGRIQATETRDDKIKRTLGSTQCHKYYKAADDKEQVDAVVSIRKSEGQVRVGLVQQLKPRRVMKQNDSHGGDAAQRVDFLQPTACQASTFISVHHRGLPVGDSMAQAGFSSVTKIQPLSQRSLSNRLMSFS